MADLPSNAREPNFPSQQDRRSDPPHPMDTEWHIHVNGQTYGPYSGHRLGEFAKDGRIDGSTQVLEVGSGSWVHAADDRRLAPIFRKISSQNAAHPPINAAAGSTVVHVTNQIPAGLGINPALLFDDGAFGAKSAGVALLLSFLLCGAGQMYCGKVGKGFLMLFGAIALWLVFLGWIIQIWSMVDAYQTAKRMNLRFLQRLQAGYAV